MQYLVSCSPWFGTSPQFNVSVTIIKSNSEGTITNSELCGEGTLETALTVIIVCHLICCQGKTLCNLPLVTGMKAVWVLLWTTEENKQPRTQTIIYTLQSQVGKSKIGIKVKNENLKTIANLSSRALNHHSL